MNASILINDQTTDLVINGQVVEYDNDEKTNTLVIVVKNPETAPNHIPIDEYIVEDANN